MVYSKLSTENLSSVWREREVRTRQPRAGSGDEMDVKAVERNGVD